jgi:Transglutaminase-like superfamily
MIKYYLHRDAFTARVASSLVFLDLRTHKYSAVDAPNTGALMQLVPGPHNGVDPDSLAASSPEENQLLAELVDAGLLTSDPGLAKELNACIPTSERALPARPYSISSNEVQIGDFIRFLISWIMVSSLIAFHNMSLCVSIVRRNQDAPAGRETQDLELEKQVRKFNRIRPWFYTAKGNCLRDALILATYLKHNGSPTSFTIGVRLHPFEAHAWVQAGPIVLNDTLESIQAYTPILSV